DHELHPQRDLCVGRRLRRLDRSRWLLLRDGRLNAEHESKQENELLHGDRLLHGLKPASAGRGGCLASAPDCKTPPTAIGLTSTGRTASSPGRASIGCSDDACSKASSARRPFTASETILP